MACTQCGARTVWDDDVGSAVCTSCGSLVDPSQSVLTSAQFSFQNDTTAPSLYDPAAFSTLKSLRSGKNWDLAGQGKESRDRKNQYAMADFIKSLAVSFNAPGLSPRAITLFNQARSAANFHWGKKSRSVAAACFAIALRESNRPDSLRDIAFVLSIPPASVAHEFMSITSTLGLSLAMVDPSVHIPSLQTHLSSVLTEREKCSGLPPSLIKPLRSLCLRTVANTATSICQLLARLSPYHDVLHLPVPPTACGIFLLALEAEIRAVLNPLGDLAQCLGMSCVAAKTVVMSRYKIIQDEIALWIERVPWLDKFESKSGRAKVSKRLVVARGIKDVIQFQDEIWQQQAKPSLDLDLSDDESKEDDALGGSIQPIQLPRPPKRKLNHTISQANRFLLDPLGTSVSAILDSSPSSNLPLLTYILTTSSSLGRRLPTRLQLLAMDRGGAREAQIADDELFVEDEFQKLLRDEDEIALLRETFGWPEGEDHDEEDEKKRSRPKKKRKRNNTAGEGGIDPEDGIIDGSALRVPKTSRLDMDALARFLAGDQISNDGESDGGDIAEGMQFFGLDEALIEDYDNMGEVSDDETHLIPDTTPSPGRFQQRQNSNMHCPDDPIAIDYAGGADLEVILENWRSTTPDRSAAFEDSRYEEEYD